jgi:hypothetical protein
MRPQRKEVVPDAGRTHGRTALQQHHLAPLRQPPGDGPAGPGRLVLLNKNLPLPTEVLLAVLNAEQRSWLRDTVEHLPRGQTAPVPRT